jgi:hypothetical protein
MSLQIPSSGSFEHFFSSVKLRVFNPFLASSQPRRAWPMPMRISSMFSVLWASMVGPFNIRQAGELDKVFRDVGNVNRHFDMLVGILRSKKNTV